MKEPPLPWSARGRWWLWPAFVVLLALSASIAAGLLAGALVVSSDCGWRGA